MFDSPDILHPDMVCCILNFLTNVCRFSQFFFDTDRRQFFNHIFIHHFNLDLSNTPGIVSRIGDCVFFFLDLFVDD